MCIVRIDTEPTPEGRLAAVARAEIYRHIRMRRAYPPDFADLKEALEIPVKAEILSARIEEAQLKPANNVRISELIRQMQELVVKSLNKGEI
jgi:hypothetical protein